MGYTNSVLQNLVTFAVAILLLFGSAALLIVWDRRRRRGLDSGDSGRIQFFSRVTAHATSSVRWWVLLLPLVFIFNDRCADIVYQKAELGRFHLSPEQQADDCRSMAAGSAGGGAGSFASEEIWPAVLSASFRGTLSAPYLSSRVPIESPLTKITALAGLAWLAFRLGRTPERMKPLGKLPIAAFALMLAASLGALVNLVKDTRAEFIIESFPLWELMIFDFLARNHFIWDTAALSIWFYAVWRAAGSTDGGADNGPEIGEMAHARTIISNVFPAMLLIVLLGEGIDYLTGTKNTPPFGTGSVSWTLIAKDSLLVWLAWALFPLPFLCARHSTGLKSGLIMLASTWQRRCPELLVLAGVAVMINLFFSGLGMASLFWYESRLSSFEECMSSMTMPDAINLISSAIGTVCATGLVVIMSAAFQSGALDIAEEKPGRVDCAPLGLEE